jgi:uncharacterized coiled-coil protein SlyX
MVTRIRAAVQALVTAAVLVGLAVLLVLHLDSREKLQDLEMRVAAQGMLISQLTSQDSRLASIEAAHSSLSQKVTTVENRLAEHAASHNAWWRETAVAVPLGATTEQPLELAMNTLLVEMVTVKSLAFYAGATTASHRALINNQEVSAEALTTCQNWALGAQPLSRQVIEACRILVLGE